MAGRHESERADHGSARPGPVDDDQATPEPRTGAADSAGGGADGGADEDQHDDAVEYSAEVDLSDEEGPPGGGSRT
jgi:hypothetical protein